MARKKPSCALGPPTAESLRRLIAAGKAPPSIAARQTVATNPHFRPRVDASVINSAPRKDGLDLKGAGDGTTWLRRQGASYPVATQVARDLSRPPVAWAGIGAATVRERHLTLPNGRGSNCCGQPLF